MGEMGPGLSHQWQPRLSRCPELVTGIDSRCSINSQNSKGGLTLLKVWKGQNTQTQGTGHTHGTWHHPQSTGHTHGTDLRALDTHICHSNLEDWAHTWHMAPTSELWAHTWYMSSVSEHGAHTCTCAQEGQKTNALDLGFPNKCS